MNGQEGILTLESENFQARVSILKIGIRPLNYTSHPPDLLRSVLLKEKVLSESQFQNTFSTWTPGSSHPGDYLISRRILTPETVQIQLRKQLEDVIFQIFRIRNLKYEFLAGADPTAYELFSPDDLGQHLIYNANGILMETVRRDDEWERFRESIPESSEIYKVDKTADFNSDNLKRPPSNVQQIRDLLNGERSIDRIVEESSMSDFEVYDFLFTFKEMGYIRPLDLDEKRSLAERLRKSLRPEDAITIFRSLLLNDPNDVETRKKLLDLLIKNKAPSAELATLQIELATLHEEDDPDQAIEYLQKAGNLTQNNITVIEKLFDLHCKAGRDRDALSAARSLVQLAKERLDSSTAINLLYKFINFYPAEVALFHELAETLAATGNTEEAAECLKCAAEVYEHRKDYNKLRRTYEKIVRLRPSEAHKLKKIKESERRVQRSRSYLLKFTACSLFVGLFAGFLTVVGFNELRSRELFLDVQQNVIALRKYKSYGQAKKVLGDFFKVFPLSSVQKEAYALSHDLDRLAEEAIKKEIRHVEQKTFAVQAKFTKAKIKYKDKDYIVAFRILRSMNTSLLPDNLAEQANELKDELETYFETARELAERAQHQYDNGEYATCHRLRKTILYRFPYAPAATDLEVPVYVETIPSGAEVFVGERLWGTTPLAVLIDPRASMPHIVVSKPDYDATVLGKLWVKGKLFSAIDIPSIKLLLTKTIQWSFPAGDSIECSPVTVKDRVYFGTRNGVVYCLDSATGKQAWQFSVDYKMDVNGAIGTWKDRVFFGSANGRLYIVDATSGTLEQKIKASPNLLPIKEPPSPVNDKAATFLNCGSKFLTAVDLSSGEILWTQSYQQRRLIGQPMIRPGYVYVATSSGEILQAAQNTGELRKVHVVTTSQVTVPPSLYGKRIYLIDKKNTIHAFDLDTTNVMWEFTAEKRLTAPATADSDRVLVPNEDGEILCLDSSGHRIWKRPLGKSISSNGMIFKNQHIVGTKTGHIVSLDTSSGELTWTYKTATREGAGFLRAGAIDRGRLFIGSQNGFFYCVTLD